MKGWLSKKLTILIIILFTSFFCLTLLSVFQLVKRVKLERPKTFAIAVNEKDFESDKFDACRVRSFSSATIGDIKAEGIPIVEVKQGDDIKKIRLGTGRCVLLFENNVINDPETVNSGGFYVALSEFEKPVGFNKIPLERIMTLHTIRDKDLVNYDEAATVARYVRAAVERNISILYLKNAAYKEKLKEALKEHGTLASPKIIDLKGMGNTVSVRFKKLFVLFLALIMPVLAFLFSRSFKAVSLQFSFITLMSLLTSIVIAGCLSETVFMLKLEQFMGVKAALLLPPLFVFFFLAYENKQFFKGKVVGITAAVLLSVIVIGVIARSGNYSMPLLPFEKELREWFEKVFVARPRLKEFMIGHPALLLGLYVYNLTKNSLEKVLAVFLIALGMLGQTSMINTFCHAHADFMLSVWRTLFGLAIGVLLGVVLILCRKIVQK